MNWSDSTSITSVDLNRRSVLIARYSRLNLSIKFHMRGVPYRHIFDAHQSGREGICAAT